MDCSDPVGQAGVAGRITDREREWLSKSVHADAAVWRAEAWAAYSLVSDELERARCQTSRRSQKTRLCEIEIAQRDLDDALLAMAPPGRDGKTSFMARVFSPLTRIWRGLKLYYSGARIERTWSAIHRANAALYMLYLEGELWAQAGRLHELISGLPGMGSRLPALTSMQESLKKNSIGRSLRTRATLRELYQEAMGVSDALQVEARVLRNSLLIASGALSLVVIALGVAHCIDPSFLSLCEGEGVCPTGKESHSFDVFAVALVGTLGGALSTVIPIATGERIKAPYRVFNHQLLLKMVSGAAAGIAGVVLIESGFISGLTLKSEAAILGYAVFFGFAQQALTGVVDHRASTLAKETPSTKSV